MLTILKLGCGAEAKFLQPAEMPGNIWHGQLHKDHHDDGDCDQNHDDGDCDRNHDDGECGWNHDDSECGGVVWTW